MRKLLVIGAVGLLVALVAANVFAIRRQQEGRTRELFAATRQALADGDLDMAEVAARRARESLPDDREALYVLALVLEAQGRSSEARALLVPEVERDIGWYPGRVLLAAIAQTEEDYAGALEWLPDGSVGGKVPATAYRILAEVRAATGDLAGAAAAYDTAVELDPSDVATLLGRADVALAEFVETSELVPQRIARNAYEAAERICRARIRQRQGDVAAARIGLAKALVGRVRLGGQASIAAARTELEAMVAEAGGGAEARLLLADFLRRVGQIGDARTTLDEAVRDTPTPALRIARALVMTEQGESANALAALEQGVRAHPESVELRLAVIDGLVSAGRLDDAQDAVGALLVGAPDDARSHEAAGDLARSRARSAAERGEVADATTLRAEARAAYAAAVGLRPRSMPLRKKSFGEQLEAAMSGDATLTDEERLAAGTYVEDVLRVNPGDADALAWRARLLLLEGDADAVVQILADVVSGPLPALDLLRLYGVGCERTGRHMQAADAFTRALERRIGTGLVEDEALRRASPEDWSHVVRSTLRAGRKQPAIGRANEAVRAWPEDLGLRLLRARVRIVGDSPRAAALGLAQTVGDFPDAPEPRLLLAAILERDGRPAEAEAVLRDGAALGDAVRVALAGLLGRTGRVREMETALRVALAEASDAGHVQLLTGNVFLSLDPPDTARARGAFERAAESPPHRNAALVRLAEFALLRYAADPGARDDVRTAVDAAVSASGEGVTADYLRGKLDLLEGRPAEALERLRGVANGRDPSAVELYYLSLAQRANGDKEAAQESLHRAIDDAPGDERIERALDGVRVELGTAALAAGRFSDAVQLLADAPPGGRAELLVAVARAGLLEFDLGADLVRRHLEVHPGDLAARHVLAAMLLQMGGASARAEAAEVYGRLVDDAPDDARAHVGLGATCLALGDHDRAERAFRAAHALLPTDVEIVRGVVDALLGAGKSDDAARFVETVAPQLGGGAAADALAGDLLLRTQEFEGALAAYMRAVAADPRAVRPLLGAAAAQIALGDEQKARETLAGGADRVDAPASVYAALVELHLRADALDDAERALASLRSISHDNARVTALRGELAARRGDVSRAVGHYASAYDRGARDVATMLRFAELLRDADEPARARRTYEAVLQVDRENVVALNNLALVLAGQRRDLPRAVELAVRASELVPESPEVADTLGWALVQNGEPGKALAPLRRAVQQLDASPDVHFHLGVAAARVGLTDEAVSHLERALELDDAFPAAASARSELSRLR